MEESYNGAYMKKGLIGEEKGFSLIRCFFGRLKDLRKDKEFRKKDIDCKFILDGREQFVEIKYDEHIGRTNNFLFETHRIYQKGNTVYNGWFNRSKADWLMFWAPNQKRIYMFDFAELRDMIQYLSKEEKKDYEIESDEKKDTHGFLVSEYIILDRILNKRIFREDSNGWTEISPKYSNVYVDRFDGNNINNRTITWQAVCKKVITSEDEREIKKQEIFDRIAEKNAKSCRIKKEDNVRTINQHPLFNKN